MGVPPRATVARCCPSQRLPAHPPRILTPSQCEPLPWADLQMRMRPVAKCRPTAFGMLWHGRSSLTVD